MEALNCTDTELSNYLQALGEGCLPICSSAMSQSEQLKSIPIASKLYQDGRKMVTFRGFHSLMMLPSSKVNHGEGSSMLLPEDFLARTFPVLGKEKGSPENDLGFGDIWLESSVKYDPNTYSWKTHRCLLQEDLPESSVTLPKEGMMQDGCVYQRRTSARSTRGKGSGLWQTPVSDDSVNRSKGKINSRGEPKLSAQVKQWPTPTAQDGNGRTHHNQRDGSKTLSLLGTIQSFPTPNATDYKGPSQPYGRRPECDDDLPSRIAKYPTPTNSMITVGDMEQARFSGNDPKRPSYKDANKMFPTPNATDATKWSNQSLEERKRKGQQIRLNTMVSPQGGQGGSLNPDWVELLMGWPKGWSGLGPLASIDDDWYTWTSDWERNTPRVATKQPDRTNRIKAIGNGQVSLCAATAWRILNNG